MAEMKFICMYKDYVDLFRDLTDVRRGRLIMAVLEYAFCGTEPELRGEERMAFISIRNQLQRDREKYEQTCQRNLTNGKKGGRPKKAKASEENPGVSEKPKEKEKEKKKEKENTNENPKESESVYPSAQEKLAHSDAHTRFCVEDVKNYCLEHDLSAVDPERFYDYYQSVGWMSGNHRITDWQAALRNWNRQDAARLAPKEEENSFDFLDRNSFDFLDR